MGGKQLRGKVGSGQRRTTSRKRGGSEGLWQVLYTFAIALLRASSQPATLLGGTYAHGFQKGDYFKKRGKGDQGREAEGFRLSTFKGALIDWVFAREPNAPNK